MKLQDFARNFDARLNLLRIGSMLGKKASDEDLLALNNEKEKFLQMMQDFRTFSQNNRGNTSAICNRLNAIMPQTKKLDEALRKVEEQM